MRKRQPQFDLPPFAQLASPDSATSAPRPRIDLTLPPEPLEYRRRGTIHSELIEPAGNATVLLLLAAALATDWIAGHFAPSAAAYRAQVLMPGKLILQTTGIVMLAWVGEIDLGWLHDAVLRVGTLVMICLAALAAAAPSLHRVPFGGLVALIGAAVLYRWLSRWLFHLNEVEGWLLMVIILLIHVVVQFPQSSIWL